MSIATEIIGVHVIALAGLVAIVTMVPHEPFRQSVALALLVLADAIVVVGIVKSHRKGPGKEG